MLERRSGIRNPSSYALLIAKRSAKGRKHGFASKSWKITVFCV
jgi:hypothetical protein